MLKPGAAHLICWALAAQLARVAGGEYTGGYPDYKDQGEFTSPCGRKHTGSDCSELSDMWRAKPYLTSVSGRPKDYTWAGNRCPPQRCPPHIVVKYYHIVVKFANLAPHSAQVGRVD
jgi:hypothetical protein